MEEGGPSKKEKLSNGGLDFDLNEEGNDASVDSASAKGFDEQFLKDFCKRASMSFFKYYGLTSHQINSYNDFIDVGIQNVFDSMGEIIIEPGYDPSKKGENEWRYASVRFGKVTLERPRFWTGEKFPADGGRDYLEFLPRHAHLQNMTYSSRMKVEFTKQIYTQKLVRSDKFKTGKEKHLEKKIIDTEEREVYIGRIPVMVNSDSCWMSGIENDCDFDQGGYFIIKGAEKIFIAQEHLGLNRVSVTNTPNWQVQYCSIHKKERVYVKLAENPKIENVGGGVQFVTVCILGLMDIPIWILFFALGVSSDKEVVNLIDADIEDGKIVNILLASIYEADRRCKIC